MIDFSIIDEITGNFQGWEYLSLVFGFVFLALAVWLLAGFAKRRRTEMFSYVTVGRLGLGLFFLILAFFRIRYYIEYGDSGTFSQLIVSLIFSARAFVMVAAPVTSLFALALIIANCWLIAHEGFRPVNLYAPLVGLAILLANSAVYYIEYHPLELMMPNALKNIWYCLYCYFCCLFIAVVICGVTAGLSTPGKDKDYILILGCRVRKDGTLYPLIKSRVDRALQFASEEEAETGKKPVFLPSGGKGSDEQVSEGDAMKRYLLENGIPEERILVENKSTTTRENMLFSRALIDNPDANVAFSTSSFHVFRGGMLAKSIGWNLEGIGGKTVWYYWPNAFMREFIGLLAASWKGQTAFVAVVSAIAAGLTLFI